MDPVNTVLIIVIIVVHVCFISSLSFAVDNKCFLRLFLLESSDLEQEASAIQKQKVRASITAVTYTHMTSVFCEKTSVAPPSKLTAPTSLLSLNEMPDVASVVSSITEPLSSEVHNFFAAANVLALHQLGGSDILIEVSNQSMTHMKQFRSIYEEEIKAGLFSDAWLPLNVSDALSVRLG